MNSGHKRGLAQARQKMPLLCHCPPERNAQLVALTTVHLQHIAVLLAERLTATASRQRVVQRHSRQPRLPANAWHGMQLAMQAHVYMVAEAKGMPPAGTAAMKRHSHAERQRNNHLL